MLQRRSARICSLFLPRYALLFILHSIMSLSKTSFLSTCPNHLCFRCQMVFNVSFFVHFFRVYRRICFFVFPTDLYSILILLQDGIHGWGWCTPQQRDRRPCNNGNTSYNINGRFRDKVQSVTVILRGESASDEH